MTRTRSVLVCLAMAGGLFAAVEMPVGAAPVCHVSVEAEALCGFRIFAEPLQSGTFVQHDGLPQGALAGEYELGIKALAARFPRFVKVSTLSDLLENPAALSYGGRQIWVIEVTDFQAPEAGKVPIAVSMSVHGPERAGLEGGVRYAEDLARWGTGDPGHLLRNGTEPDSTGITAGEVLRRTHIYLSNINPDGWARGDLHNGGLFSRGNGRSVDLNREFPTMGWSNTAVTHLSEPEAIHWKAFMDLVQPKAATDIHGELTSVNNAFADIMLPAGEWDPLERAREARLARHMTSNVYRYFDENNVVLGDIAGLPPAAMRPADYATGYDVVGYDAAGFMGDWLTQAYDALELDIEHFLSHLAPNSAWLGPLEQAHVAAVRGEIEALIVDALTVDQVQVNLKLGRAGYVFDPTIVTDADGYAGPPPPPGYSVKPYSVTPMRFFEELSRYSDRPLVPLGGNDILEGRLEELDSLVMINPTFAPDQDEPFAVTDVIAELRAWVQEGGNLILTDKALTLLDDLGVVPTAAVDGTARLQTAGHVDIATFGDPYTQGLHTTSSQTYYEVPLGYQSTSSSTRFSPHWTVEKGAWTAAGGVTVGTVDSTSRVALGRAPLGEGTIGIFGAVLPPPNESTPHFYGLANHAVTVAGGQILTNMITRPSAS